MGPPLSPSSSFRHPRLLSIRSRHFGGHHSVIVQQSASKSPYSWSGGRLPRFHRPYLTPQIAAPSSFQPHAPSTRPTSAAVPRNSSTLRSHSNEETFPCLLREPLSHQFRSVKLSLICRPFLWAVFPRKRRSVRLLQLKSYTYLRSLIPLKPFPYQNPKTHQQPSRWILLRVRSLGVSVSL